MKDAKRPSQVLAAQLSEWRRFRGLRADQLAERIGLLGGRLGRATISKIEHGKRNVSLDEALLLAAALNVPPPLLIFPMKSGDHVRITSKSTIHPDLATRWLAGDGPLAVTDRTAMGLHEFGEARWTEAARPLRLYDDHREAQRFVHAAEGAIQRARVAEDPAGEKKARYRRADRLRRLADVRTRMRAEAMTPPKLDVRWSAEMKRLGEEG